MELVKYCRESKEELSKVIFPTKDQIKVASISVIVVVMVVTLFLSLVDFILKYSLLNII